MNVVILTGPAGAGKNTVGYALAKTRKRCAVIDVDLVRWMLCQPHKGPWEGAEGVQQQLLAVKNTSMLTKNFVEDSADVIILDVVTNDTAKLYREQLQQYNPHIVLLLPTFEETQKRVAERQFRITQEEEKLVYEWQEALNDFDTKIDNTTRSVEELVQNLQSLFTT